MYDCFAHLGVGGTLKAGDTHIQYNPIWKEEHTRCPSKRTDSVLTSPAHLLFDVCRLTLAPNILMRSLCYTEHLQGHCNIVSTTDNNSL